MDDQQNITFMWPSHLPPDNPMMRNLNSTEEYLAYLCGPKRSRLSLPMTLVYAAIFFIGVIGNTLVCLVILKHHNMRTPTNYYLFSLAVSDLLVLLLGMPLEVYEMWSNYPFLFGAWGCYFKTVLFETVCFASILSVTTVSVERYVAIIHPFQAKLKSTRSRALKILVTLWIFSILFSIPNTSTHGILLQYFPNGSLIPDSATCTVVQPLWIYNCIIQVTSLLFYILPMGVISVLYCLMGIKLRGDHSLEANKMSVNVQRPSRKSITKMLFVLVMVFGVCWAPFHVDRLFFSFVVDWTEHLANAFNLTHVVSGVFFYLSSAVNPLIYNLLSRRFRSAFQNVLPHLFKSWKPKIPVQALAPQKRTLILAVRNRMDSGEEGSPTFPHRTSVCSSHLSTVL
ncbi:neuromedin-U receptor 2 [Xenopus laevis]|uniref:Neuromedin-U receptor 2 n=2 Tax=Xenopus laevis TaxID=8355 RepID=A0A8J0UU02_XENLA|nr:neuromedin-U receptor 2 [Xenopus laevis]